MYSIFNILFLSLLSFTIPIGKLFEIFIWNDRVTKTESVIQLNRIDKKRRLCFFVKIVKKSKALLIAECKKKQLFLLKEIFQNITNNKIQSIQTSQFNQFKNHLKKGQIFNIIYFDEEKDYSFMRN